MSISAISDPKAGVKEGDVLDYINHIDPS